MSENARVIRVKCEGGDAVAVSDEAIRVIRVIRVTVRQGGATRAEGENKRRGLSYAGGGKKKSRKKCWWTATNRRCGAVVCVCVCVCVCACRRRVCVCV